MAVSAGALRFRPRLWPSLATLAGLALLLGLGSWQLERLRSKQALIAARTVQLAAPAQSLPATAVDWRGWDFRKVSIEGTFRHDLEQRFGAFTREGRFGQHVLTPLVRPDGAAILVDRGFVPADRSAIETRRQGQVAGRLEITGIARYRGADRPGWFTPANQPGERTWYWYDLAALARAVGLELLPVVVEADASPNPGGLPEGGQTVTRLPNHHLQYAITWYGLAAALIAVYVAFCLDRGGRR